MALAIAKWVGGVQAVSGTVSFVRHDASLSYVPEFVTKTVLFSNSLPRSSLVASWLDYAAGLDDELLLYLSVPSIFLLIRTSSFFLLFLVVFFLSPGCPSQDLLKTDVSFFLRGVSLGLVLQGRRYVLWEPLGSGASLPRRLFT